jgi:hypothetical protein
MGKQMKRVTGLMTVILTMLAGCDQMQEVMDNQQQPNVMLGAGIEVQIGDNQTAKVFGPDLCETGFDDNDTSDDVPGCTILTGNDQVRVTLTLGEEKRQEAWTVTRNNDRYSLSRPNGYIVREAEIIN